jgi:hypothetical protein
MNDELNAIAAQCAEVDQLASPASPEAAAAAANVVSINSALIAEVKMLLGIVRPMFELALPYLKGAPAGWSMVTRKGRHRGLRVYGASQRPAAIDKHFFGNASVIRTGRLNYAADVKTMADVLDVTSDEIRELPALAWIERDMRSGKVRRGSIEF